MTFDEFISAVDHPMLIVTTATRDTRAGCLVGFHSQCSIEPARYAVWLSRANRTFRVAVLAEVFALHFLEETDRGLAVLFGAHTGDDEDKFAHCAWEPGTDGVPLLRCRARVTARRVALHDDGGDHVCFVLAPEDTAAPVDFAPLLFSRVKDLDAGHEADDAPKPA